MRTALIVGASGQDGRLLARLLRQRGVTVHGWSRTAPVDPPCPCDQVDLLKPFEVSRALAMLQPHEIYYLAAFHHATEEVVELPTAEILQRSLEVHVVGLQNILETLKLQRREARLFYAASSHVFGPSAAGLQDEETPLQPVGPYAISKAAGLRCCQRYRQEAGVFAATGILFNHESSLRKSSFLSQKIVRGALRARRVPRSKLILGDLDARVDWGYAPDYAEAMFRILQLPEADDFVVASGELHSVREFAEIAFRAVGRDWRDHVEVDPSLLKKSPTVLCGDSGKLRRASGWRPSVSFEEMGRTLVAEASALEAMAPALSQPKAALAVAELSAAAHC
jgi:GDPmannose 4,6-dehydratase